jgi:hypothetical protein
MENINRFYHHHKNVNWNFVIVKQDVNIALELYWQEFALLDDSTFHKNNPDTTKTNQKAILRPKACLFLVLIEITRPLTIANPCPENLNKYKIYRNIYNSLI